MNGGLADIGSLYDCLVAIHEGSADDSILEVYSNIRRDKWFQFVDPQSRFTMEMIFSDPNKLQDHPFYKISQLMKKNPEEARRNAPVSFVLKFCQDH